MKVVFRVDASLQIGTGHVIRCIVLATALRNWGADCIFICRFHNGNLVEKIKKNGFEVIVLSDFKKIVAKSVLSPSCIYENWLGVDWQDDARDTAESVSEMYVDWLVVDHYALDHRWENFLRSYVSKILVIDDLANRKHDCDILIDQNLIEGYHGRYEGLVTAKCVQLLGPSYAIVHSDYAKLHKLVTLRRQKNRVERILLFFGGVDYSKFTLTALNGISSLRKNDICFDVVITSSNPNSEEIKKIIRKQKNVILHKDVSNLSSLIFHADLAVTAGGTICWECCCLGLPSMVVTQADNQIPIADALSQKGAIRWLGTCNEVSSSSLALEIKKVIDDNGIKDWALCCSGIVDGRGAERIATAMLISKKTPLFIRLANKYDELHLLNLANDPLVRINSFSPGLISEKTHHEWFSSKLKASLTSPIYLIETMSDILVGQVRFEYLIDHWEVHYSLAPVARNKGLGKKILEKAFRIFGMHYPDVRVVGHVRWDNKVSQRIFKQLGFTEGKTHRGYLYEGCIDGAGYVY